MSHFSSAGGGVQDRMSHFSLAGWVVQVCLPYFSSAGRGVQVCRGHSGRAGWCRQFCRHRPIQPESGRQDGWRRSARAGWGRQESRRRSRKGLRVVQVCVALHFPCGRGIPDSWRSIRRRSGRQGRFPTVEGGRLKMSWGPRPPRASFSAPSRKTLRRTRGRFDE